ncbi:MAG TPA: hypothetical protein VJX67_20270 [Blastocatellia bacterium]|nr:hypothetical protein [Blastocatellia bacterium]
MRVFALHSHRFLLIGFCLCLLTTGMEAQDATDGASIGNILTGVKLSQGLNLGVDSSKHERTWLKPEKAEGYFAMSFLPEQEWSAAFITVGSVRQRSEDRKYRDYSAFKTLSVEMRGSVGGERVEVGIKSKDQPDDGTETKITVILTREWKSYEFSLDEFKGVNLRELYVVAEFVYTCAQPQTVLLRSVKYLKEPAMRPQMGDAPCESPQSGAFDIMEGTKLSGGFGLGVNSSEGLKDWVSKKEGEFMIMSFPPDQDWSAAFITVGPPNQRLKDGRQSKDLSAFNFLSVDLKGAVGKEKVDIGIKDNTQEDDGTETKIPIELTSEWKTYQFELDRFTGTSPLKLYVVAEFVYEGSSPQTVFLRNIKYLKGASETVAR